MSQKDGIQANIVKPPATIMASLWKVRPFANGSWTMEYCVRNATDFGIQILRAYLDLLLSMLGMCCLNHSLQRVSWVRETCWNSFCDVRRGGCGICGGLLRNC